MKQSSKKHELGTAALYCRLSRDDNTHWELLLRKYWLRDKN